MENEGYKTLEWKMAMALQKELEGEGFGRNKFIPVYVSHSCPGQVGDQDEGQEAKQDDQIVQGYSIVLVRNGMNTVGALEFLYKASQQGNRIETKESLSLWFFRRNHNNFSRQTTVRNLVHPFEFGPEDLPKVFDTSGHVLSGELTTWTDSNGLAGGRSRNFELLTDQHWAGFTPDDGEQQIEIYLSCLKLFHSRPDEEVNGFMDSFEEQSAASSFLEWLDDWEISIGELPSWWACISLTDMFSFFRYNESTDQ